MRPDFDEIYQRHAAEFFRYLRRLLGSRVPAQELLQEAFLKLHVRIVEGKEIDNVRAWLFTLRRVWRTIAAAMKFARRNGFTKAAVHQPLL